METEKHVHCIRLLESEQSPLALLNWLFIASLDFRLFLPFYQGGL